MVMEFAERIISVMDKRGRSSSSWRKVQIGLLSSGIASAQSHLSTEFNLIKKPQMTTIDYHALI